ncbi:hypothetical protein [Streptomyces collinus]|uniref:hypothetical protein n=1 Tax=Streptomyces collinus TaxID=42684 RepID=UPI0036409473
MSSKPVVPTNVYPGTMAPHMPIEQYRAAHGCTCGHGHGQAPVQQIIVKQSDPWVRYMAIGFAGASIGLLVLASVVAALIAAGLCALCVAVATWALRALLSGRKDPKKP